MTRHSAPFGGRLLQSERIIVTIPQAPDGINLYLQLFNLKLRSCIFCSLSVPIMRLLGISYNSLFSDGFPSESPRKIPGFSILLPTVYCGQSLCSFAHGCPKNARQAPAEPLHLQPSASAPAFCRRMILSLHFYPSETEKAARLHPALFGFRFFSRNSFSTPASPVKGL